jgi:hypothetical protein
VIEDGPNHGLEKLIQSLKDELRWVPLGESGETANVTEEEGGLVPRAFLIRHQTTPQQLFGDVFSHVGFEQLRLLLLGQGELVALLLPGDTLLPIDTGLDTDDEVVAVAR